MTNFGDGTFEVQEMYVTGMGFCDRRIRRLHTTLMMTEREHGTFHLLESLGGPLPEGVELHDALLGAQLKATLDLSKAVIGTMN